MITCSQEEKGKVRHRVRKGKGKSQIHGHIKIPLSLLSGTGLRVDFLS